jgi:hypothetical protein
MNKKQYFGMLLGLLVATNAEAVVYRCVSPDGAVTYQDIGCTNQHPENRSLPIALNPRLKNRPNPHAGVTTLIKKKELSTFNAAQQQQKALRQAEAAKAKAQKQAAWRANLCEHAQSQKADILATLRHGYRATAKHHLKERLKKIEERERRYCQTTWHH